MPFAEANLRGDHSSTKEDLMHGPAQEEDIVYSVDHQSTEEETHYPPSVLFDLAAQRPVKGSPGCKKNERNEQMGWAHAENGAVRHMKVDKEGNEGRRNHEAQEQAAKPAMPPCSLAADEEQPCSEQERGNNRCYVRLHCQRRLKQRLKGHCAGAARMNSAQ
jgi:hypothetical protein